MRPAILPQACEDGTADKVMLGLKVVRLRVCQLVAMLLRFRISRSKRNAQFYKQWEDITAKLRAPTGALKAVAAEGMVWATRIFMIGRASLFDWQLRDSMIAWASDAKAQVKARSTEQNKVSKTQYDRWVDGQLRLGAGALHALTKRADVPSEEAVYVHRAKSPNTVVEEKKKAEKARVAKIARAALNKDRAGANVLSGSAAGDLGAKVRVSDGAESIGVVGRARW